MNVARLQHTTTSTEAQTAVMDWLQAAEEFHRNYIKIGEALQTRTLDNARVTLSEPVGSRSRNLQKLRQHMKLVLETLLMDMSRPSASPQHSTELTSPSKAGQLVTHTRLLNEISRKINRELIQYPVVRV